MVQFDRFSINNSWNPQKDLTHQAVIDWMPRFEKIGLHLKGVDWYAEGLHLVTGFKRDVMDYLNALIDEQATLPIYYPAGFVFDNIRQQVRIREKTTRYDAEKAARIEAEQQAATGSHPELAEVLYKHPYSFLNEEQERVVEWDTLRERVRLAVILGNPGSGKTWLLKYEALRAAQEARHQLQSGQSLDEIVLPVMLRLDTWADKLHSITQDPFEAMLKSLEQQLAPSGFFLKLFGIGFVNGCVKKLAWCCSTVWMKFRRIFESR